jgi:hypothetical protein
MSTIYSSSSFAGVTLISFATDINQATNRLRSDYKHGYFITGTFPTDENRQRHYQHSNRFVRNLLTATKDDIVSIVGLGKNEAHLILMTDTKITNSLFQLCWRASWGPLTHQRDLDRKDGIKYFKKDVETFGWYLADHHIIKPARLWTDQIVQNGPSSNIQKINQLINTEATLLGRIGNTKRHITAHFKS